MEFLKVITERRSIRRFKPDEVPDEMIRELLKAARLAPSGENCQPWRFVVIKGQACKDQLAEAVAQPFVIRAPLIIVACVDRMAMTDNYLKQRTDELFKARSYYQPPVLKDNSDVRVDEGPHLREINQSYLELNLAIAIDHLTLRAVDLGLGACWVMNFNRESLQEVLSLDERYEPIILLPVGFPSTKPKPRPRLPLSDISIKEFN